MSIIHETDNLYLNSKMEVCLNGTTYAVVVGKVKSLEQAVRFMNKAELYIDNLRAMYQH